MLFFAVVSTAIPFMEFHVHEHHAHEQDECGLEHQHEDHVSLAEMCNGCEHHVHFTTNKSHFHKHRLECEFCKFLSKQSRLDFYQAIELVSNVKFNFSPISFDRLERVVGNSNSLTNKGPPYLFA